MLDLLQRYKPSPCLSLLSLSRERELSTANSLTMLGQEYQNISCQKLLTDLREAFFNVAQFNYFHDESNLTIL